MKTNVSCCPALLWIALSFPFYMTAQQVNNPTEWDDFLADTKKNRTLPDTFLFQSFEKTIHESWDFREKIPGKVSIVDAATMGLSGQKGNHSLRLPVGSSLEWEVLNPLGYKGYFVTFFIAATKVQKNSKLVVSAKPGPSANVTYDVTVSDKNSPLHFGEKFKETNTFNDRVYIYNDPVNIDISVSSSDPEAAFFIDYMMAFCNTRTYSLFQEKGKWEDNTKWTHYPPYKRRSALIRGEVEISRQIGCNELHLSEGNVCVTGGGAFTGSQLFLYGNNVGVYTQGAFTVNNLATVYLTFAEKGKWYFISFPFDVYRTDIDPLFELKGEEPNEGGDLYYVLTYDGAQRAVTNSLNNWKVIPENYPADIPLFERGKGYLFALDEQAVHTRLSFSSREGECIEWNRESFTSSYDIPLKKPHMKEEHYGWLLCGNPFPAPLPVKSIRSNDLQTDVLYYFDGDQYKEVKLTDNFSLPPFSSFFLKARSSATIRIEPPVTIQASEILPVKALTNHGEPVQAFSSGSSDISQPFTHEIRGNTLLVSNCLQEGNLSICNLSGKIVLTRSLPVGEITIPLTMPAGTYVLSLRAGKQRAQEKFILY